jgi:hypothetical protein
MSANNSYGAKVRYLTNGRTSGIWTGPLAIVKTGVLLYDSENTVVFIPWGQVISVFSTNREAMEIALGLDH